MSCVTNKDVLESFSRRWNEYTSSSSEGDSPKSASVMRTYSQRTSRGSLFPKQRQIEHQYVSHVTHGRSRGVIHVIISSDERQISVTVSKLGGLHPQFLALSSVIVKVTMETFAGGKTRFQTNPVPVTSSVITFDETLHFDTPVRSDGHRLLFCVCLKHDEPLFPDKLGWMSFGVSKLLSKQQSTEGWYCLLGKSLGKRKHLMLKKDFASPSEDVLTSDRDVISPQSSVISRTQSLRTKQEDHTKTRGPRSSITRHKPMLRHYSEVSDFKTITHKNNNISDAMSSGMPERCQVSPQGSRNVCVDKSRRRSCRFTRQACSKSSELGGYVIVQESRNYLRRAKRSRLNTNHVTASSSEAEEFQFSKPGKDMPTTNGNCSRLQCSQSPNDMLQISLRSLEDLHKSALTPLSRKSTKRRISVRRSFRKPRKVERQRSLVRFESPKTPIRKFQSDSVIQPHAMLSLSTPPPSVLHSTSPQVTPNCWDDFTLSPSFHIIDDEDFKALDEITCNAQPIKKPKPSLLNILLDPLKSKIEKKENIIDSDSKCANKKNAMKQLGEIFKSRDGHGSTISLCTSDVYFANQQKSRLSRLGAFRLSKRKKFDADALATPMTRRRKAGRHSIGDPTTPRKGLKFNDFRNNDVIYDELHTSSTEFVDATDFFSTKPRRAMWRSLLSKKSTVESRKKSSTKTVTEKPVTLETSLLKVLKSKESVTSFRKFLALEFSDENLDFWIDVEEYKEAKKFDKLAFRIFSKYIAEEAPREINIESGVRDRIVEKLSRPDVTIFNEAQLHIYKLMEKDSFRRFLSSAHNLVSSGPNKRPLDDVKRENPFRIKRKNV
uniref:Uncharacterized protein LOC100186664 n=1 Tax=Phallusia mammillata TaxID=59560 RepID=A0A6F9DJC8_9ASCI|nr:uncharacterized protein LOC100186664 [Phallusia mammillata]